jgi:hypothetical protein
MFFWERCLSKFNNFKIFMVGSIFYLTNYTAVRGA